MLFRSSHNICPTQLACIGEVLGSIINTNCNYNFQLNWEPMLQLFSSLQKRSTRNTYLFPENSEFIFMSKIPKIIHKLRKYLPPESGIQIFNYVKQFIGPINTKNTNHIIYLECFLRTDSQLSKADYEPWLNELLELWKLRLYDISLNNPMLSILSSLAKYHYEIDWDPHMEMIFERIIEQVKKPKSDMIIADASMLYSINIDSKVNRHAAKLAVYMLKPHPDGRSKVFGYIKQCIMIIRSTLYSSKIGFEFIHNLLLQLTRRMRYENSSGKINYDQKVKDIDIYQILDLIIEVIDPCMLNMNVSQELVLSIEYIAYMYPNKAFEHYIPMLLKFLDGYDIPHASPLRYLNYIINPILFHPNHPKKFQYIDSILRYSINEVISIESENNVIALSVIGKILFHIPLTDRNCMRNTYNKHSKKGAVSYDNYLIEIEKKNEFEYNYHLMLNSIEEKICDLLNKIYTLLKNKAKSEKNQPIGNLTSIVHMIITSLCNNSTDELFSHLLGNFKEFIASDGYPNAIKEVSIMIRAFSRRDPSTTAKLIPFLFRKLTFKEFDEIIWETGIGKFLKSIPKWYEAAREYTLNNCLPDDKLKYYASIICDLLAEDINAYTEYKTQIDIVLTLLLANKNKHCASIARKLISSIIEGQVALNGTMKTMISHLGNLLECYKIIGKFDYDMLNLNWRRHTKEGFEICRDLIQIICFDLGNYIFESTIDTNEVSSIWLKVITNIIPVLLPWIQKMGESKFVFIEKVLMKITKDDTLTKFFITLRLHLLSLVIKVTKKITPCFKNQTTQKLASKSMKCLIAIINITSNNDSFNPYLNKFIGDKTLYRNPILKEHTRNYFFHYTNIYNTFHDAIGITHRIYETPFPELKIAVNDILNIMGCLSKLVFL